MKQNIYENMKTINLLILFKELDDKMFSVVKSIMLVHK